MLSVKAHSSHRRPSHIHNGFVAVTPPQFVVYIMWLQVVYVGVTPAAPPNQLHKHMTDGLADVDCATLHKHIVEHHLGGWGILPLQWVHEEWLARMQERHSWWTFRSAQNQHRWGGLIVHGLMNRQVLATIQAIQDEQMVDGMG